MMHKQSLILALAVGTTLAAADARAANSAGVDTSEWKCESCPFQTGYEADAELGALYVDDDSAKFGEYNGLDEKGGYADISANGSGRSESGTYYGYDLVDLGLDTREAEVVFGREGTIEGSLRYDELPHRVWDTTVTPFSQSGSDSLVLPSDWVRASGTAGMSALGRSLAPVDIGRDRTTYGAGLAYLLGTQFEFYADYDRQEIEGNRLAPGAFLLQAFQYPEPVDATHDQVEVGAIYRFAQGFTRVSWYLSDYDNALSGVTFDNPYTPGAPDTTQGRKALAPDSKAYLIALDGNFLLPWWKGVLSYRVADGKTTQDQGFLPFSTSAALNGGLALPRSSLDGELRNRHYRASLSLQPHPRLRIRGGYRYDERDDRTAAFSSGFVEMDSAEVTVPASAVRYDYERTRFDGLGELRILDWLHVAVGGETDQVKRTNQASKETQEERAYGRVRLRLPGSLEFSAAGGQSRIDAGEYTVRPVVPPENPLLRKYNQTDRDRDFAEGRLSWSPWKLSLVMQADYASDDYRRSTYGLLSGRDERYAGTISWAVTDAVTTYLTGSYQKMTTEQAGEEVFPSAPSRNWTVSHQDEFTTAGGGLLWRDILGKLDLSVDYTFARSKGLIDTTAVPASAGSGPFPQLDTEMDSVRLRASYDVSDRLTVAAAWTWEEYDTSDWQIEGVQPATIRNVLSMSPDPYRYDINVIGLSFSYHFGGRVTDEE
jgi:MtrB/PioB family decaheme-associated outer membrane protein